MPLQAGDIVYVPFSYLRNAALGITSIAAAATGAAIYVSSLTGAVEGDVSFQQSRAI